jgi:hypothetical protein
LVDRKTCDAAAGILVHIREQAEMAAVRNIYAVERDEGVAESPLRCRYQHAFTFSDIISSAKEVSSVVAGV